MYRLHVGSNRQAWPSSGLSVTWYIQIIAIKIAVIARAGQLKMADTDVLKLDMVFLGADD
jgi:hypothetical protein